MTASIRPHDLVAVAEGDARRASRLRDRPHDELLRARKELAELVVRRPAAVRVAKALRRGGITHADAMAWAAFVSLGTTGRYPVVPVGVDLDEADAHLIEEFVGWLLESDEHLTEEEQSELARWVSALS